MNARVRISSIRLLLLMLLALAGSKVPAPRAAKDVQAAASSIAGKQQAVFHNDDHPQIAPHIITRAKVRYMGGECGFNGTALFCIAHAGIFALRSNTDYSNPVVASHNLSISSLRGPPQHIV